MVEARYGANCKDASLTSNASYELVLGPLEGCFDDVLGSRNLYFHIKNFEKIHCN